MNQSKAQTMIVAHDGKKKIAEGDLVFCIQANREQINGVDGLMVNVDWDFSDDTTVSEIKGALGRFLGNIEDIFGEKMVTEAIQHYAEDMGHMRDTPFGKVMHLRSKGITFKDWTKKETKI